ncbi:hypothetical protein QBC46DRAFT_133986 [Diplogelasinospora grovesii]|uniref:Ubiquitin-like protease family profile domain-containing protein n=1 Tax=Diplogelasinospora grovesii TaxID=303347 RepID=A0AAN6NHB1_9PEZI|nr:hypothetical protein QBC46DRAFT_133986 [Diplogelasinospora grovesii]
MTRSALLKLDSFRPMNNLSGERRRPKPTIAAPSHDPTEPPAKKRRKFVYTDGQFAVDDAFIEDREACMSQGSVSTGASAGIFEFQNVEGGVRGHSRRHRRSTEKHTAERLSPAVAQPHRQRLLHGIDPGHDEISDGEDELGQDSRLRRRPPSAKPMTSSASRPLTYYDGADAQFLTSVRRKPVLQIATKGVKRTNPAVDSDDDELTQAPGPGRFSRSDDKQLKNNIKNASSSLSRKGDLAATKWSPKSLRIPVKAAVCQQNHQYIARHGTGDPGAAGEDEPCFLQPDGEPAELRAFLENGSPALQYPWLKVTGSTKTLLHSPDCSLIRINRPAEISPAPLGAQLMMKFFNGDDAAKVVEWAQNSIRATFASEASDKLQRIYDKLVQDVRRAAQPAVQKPDDMRLLEIQELRKRKAAGMDIAAAAYATSPAVAQPSRSRPHLKDQMQVANQTSEAQDLEITDDIASYRRRSSRIRHSSPAEPTSPKPSSPALPRWTDENHKWREEWEKKPLVFQRTTVEQVDIPRLDEGQCLNDNLINFGLTYLFDMHSKRNPALGKRVYVFNSFFYEKLKPTRGTKINYEGVKNWTSKVDIFSYDYIIVPVNEYFHWWVAIICNPARLDPDAPRPLSQTDGDRSGANGHEHGNTGGEAPEVADSQPPRSPHGAATTEMSRLSIGSPQGQGIDKDDATARDGIENVVDLAAGEETAGQKLPVDVASAKRQSRKSVGPVRKYNPEDPRIITLDSLGSSHSPAVTALKQYLIAEFEDKRKKTISNPPLQLGMKATNIPEQDNFCDCGVYLLGYIQKFFENPEQSVHALLQRESPGWDFNPSDLRQRWRDLIFVEHKKYVEKQVEMKEKKRMAMAMAGREAKSPKQAANASPGAALKASAENGVARTTENIPTAISAVQTRVTSPSPDNDSKPRNSWPLRPEPVTIAQKAPRGSSLHSKESSTSTLDYDTGSTKPRGAAAPKQTVAIRAPSRPVQQEESADEVVLVSVPRDDVLPSTETPDVEEIAEIRDSQDEEPIILAKPADIRLRPPAPPVTQRVEVSPSKFFTTEAVFKPRSEAGSSPARLDQPRVAEKAKKIQSSPEARSQNFSLRTSIPVVQKAELVRNTDPIDLTEDDGK